MLGLETLVPILNVLEKLVLLLLTGLSVWSIGIMIERRRVFRDQASLEGAEKAEDLILNGKKEELLTWIKDRKNPVAQSLQTLQNVPSHTAEGIEAAFRAFSQNYRRSMEKGLNILATLGANAPFIGLFGTVLGIIEAFSALSIEQSSSDVIMASIAEALVATAAGLFVAIPAVVAFNLFSARLRTVLQKCDAVKNLYISRQENL